MPLRRSPLPETALPRALPPLLPVLLPLVVASIVLNVVFARLFPSAVTLPPPAPPRFTDVTAAAGITFVHRHARGPSPTTLGGGVAVLDFNRDGRPDLFFVNGAPWPWSDNAWQSPGTCALYLNQGDGTFADVTAAAGLDLVVNGMAAAAGDFDADGWPDLYLTAVGANRLLRNQGDGTFRDVTAEAGVGGDENTWSTAAVWLDHDGDGHLDLLVAHYARWPAEVGLAAAFSVAQVGRSYGAPVGFIGADPTLYRNLGDGRFSPVRGAAGLRHPDPDTGLPVAKVIAITPWDVNGDGRIDLRFSYHTAPPALFIARPDGTWARGELRADPRHEGAAGGIAASGARPVATIDDPADLGFLPPPPADEDPESTDLGGGPAYLIFDYDNDSRPDRFDARARIERDTNVFPDAPPRERFAGRPQVWREAAGRWEPVPGAVGEPWSNPLLARGLAALDYDGDGDTDLVLVQHDGPAQLWRNDQTPVRPWLGLRLRATRSHPAADGARVELHTPRRVFMRTVMPATGFMAQSEAGLRFGLGEDNRVRRLVIRWPSGRRQELRPTELNTYLDVVEP